MNLLLFRTLGTLKGEDWNHDDEEEEEEEGEKLEQWVIAMEVEQSAEKEVEMKTTNMSSTITVGTA